MIVAVALFVGGGGSTNSTTPSATDCAVGYHDDGTGTCDDTNECSMGIDDCDALVSCTNTAGSYLCGACPSGYEDTNGDGTQCKATCCSGANCEPDPGVPACYLPPQLQFISWDFSSIAHTSLDIDYKLTGYGWFDRALVWSLSQAPSGMTIDADGTHHWVPDNEGSSSVAVELAISGGPILSKSFSL